MIKSIKGKTTQDVYDGVNSKASRKLPLKLHQRACDILDALNAAQSPEDLRLPPSMRLHRLKGVLSSYWSVSINNQWRIIFEFSQGAAMKVEILDYHK